MSYRRPTAVETPRGVYWDALTFLRYTELHHRLSKSKKLAVKEEKKSISDKIIFVVTVLLSNKVFPF